YCPRRSSPRGGHEPVAPARGVRAGARARVLRKARTREASEPGSWGTTTPPPGAWLDWDRPKGLRYGPRRDKAMSRTGAADRKEIGARHQKTPDPRTEIAATARREAPRSPKGERAQTDWLRFAARRPPRLVGGGCCPAPGVAGEATLGRIPRAGNDGACRHETRNGLSPSP